MIQQYTPAVIRYSNVFYKKLPENAQRWITADDLMQEGLLLITKIAGVYDPEKSKFITILIFSLKNKLSNYVRAHYAQKRYNGFTDASIDDAPTTHEKHLMYKYRLYTSRTSRKTQILAEMANEQKSNTLMRSVEINADLQSHYTELSPDAQALANFLMNFEGTTIHYTIKDVCEILNLSRRRLTRAAEQCSTAIGI